MNLKQALKAVAPAVGDGKLVNQHRYVLSTGTTLVATDGSMWAIAPFDLPQDGFCVRHEALKQALERDGATLATGPGETVIVRVGRSKVTLKGIDPADFPARPNPASAAHWEPASDFRNVLEDLARFVGTSDGHIWQQGVHFTPDFAFAANPYSLIKRNYEFGHAITFPPWLVRFILAQDTSPTVIADQGNLIAVFWGSGLHIVSTRLIEDPAENIITFASNLSANQTVPVPSNLLETVERVKAYGGKNFKLGDGKLTYTDEAVEIEEEVNVLTSTLTWGVDTMLPALRHATTMYLGESPCRWEGSGYIGAFSGLSS